eukprot:CAMPEP_0169406974 /NCGR_PEP_ID=MMETSP1017-20121227/57843_1 /TAXON_ID=342587 /ORGANISM="Karlodinium micrum, Strain CCMP2283" /LENGTH=160 /DNA_ID=CAMNT_0009513827 /DNA_START=38 /DNA_END=520 /DNA_ORIENTATION=+
MSSRFTGFSLGSFFGASCRPVVCCNCTEESELLTAAWRESVEIDDVVLPKVHSQSAGKETYNSMGGAPASASGVRGHAEHRISRSDNAEVCNRSAAASAGLLAELHPVSATRHQDELVIGRWAHSSDKRSIRLRRHASGAPHAHNAMPRISEKHNEHLLA